MGLYAWKLDLCGSFFLGLLGWIKVVITLLVAFRSCFSAFQLAVN